MKLRSYLRPCVQAVLPRILIGILERPARIRAAGYLGGVFIVTDKACNASAGFVVNTVTYKGHFLLLSESVHRYIEPSVSVIRLGLVKHVAGLKCAECLDL